MQNPAAPDSSGNPERPRLEFSGDPILAARFAVPAAPTIVVRRPALLERLTAGVTEPLTLVNAPAGAGKTVLVAQWVTARRSSGTVVWLTVEPDDPPGLFWAYLLEALHRNEVPLSNEIGRPARAEGVDHSLLVRLADGLANSPDPVVVVLDQFEGLGAPEIAAELHFVLEHTAGKLRLVLIARTEPLLPLHRYRASGHITEIRNADLAFTRTESRLLLREHGLDLSPAALALLVDRTEGWAAGLRLSALAMQRKTDPESFVGAFAADRTAIADYLLTEVLDALPPQMQSLLLRTCIAEQIHPELAVILTGDDNAAWTLAALARANAFVERIDDSTWYRLHPLFAEVLHAHLRHRHPGLEPHLHALAARWYADTGRLTDALSQAAACDDWQFAANHLIESLAIGRLFLGLDTAPLRHALSAMPANVAGAAPALVEAACRLADHDLAGCTSALAHADEQLDHDADPALRLSRSFIAVLAGRSSGDLTATRNAAAEVARLLRLAPQQLVGRHPEIAPMVLAGVGSAELDAGHFDRAANALTTAVQMCGQEGTEPALCAGLGLLALVELLRGHLRRAEKHSHRSLTLADQSALLPDNLQGRNHLVLAGVALEHDDQETARAHLELVGVSAEEVDEPAAAVAAAVIGSRLATADGDRKGALAVLRTARSILNRVRPAVWMADDLAIAESAVHLAHSDVGAALEVLDAVPSVRPEHTVARARALLTTRHDDNDALEALTDLRADTAAAATVQVQACLLRAHAATKSGRTEQAHRLLRQALGFARPEELWRVFADSGPWVRRLLGQRPQLTSGHGWLPAEAFLDPHTDNSPQLPEVVQPLTVREGQVLRHAAGMLTAEEIADALSISVNTVKTHLVSIYRKLAVTSRREAIQRGRELAIL
ncbi:LuxR C-terminal-related transcriptional regulator [Rhodococcus sp. IEGM 1409]|uniref:LuxR C-terminal-related transcriptional regulator n=1 Tax=Rhodococcus sp. IEGM 1409 TaxID=3047082 RepID=UPI0024B64EDF|nr:LuxR C-terminal-related transcriptional regulator [Rhodococcus sp. IEGM 1409]MDI9899131.1 LuxR C-terminal-related transcriptional regulator [Rhodococcus sp. IEGM 1409]